MGGGGQAGVVRGKTNALKVPNAHHARVDREKIADYLLSPDNPNSEGKPGFFSRFGFSVDRWEIFAEALRLHCLRNDIAEEVETSFGIKYVVIGVIETPDGRNPSVKTVWLVDSENANPRFITAVPVRRR